MSYLNGSKFWRHFSLDTVLVAQLYKAATSTLGFLLQIRTTFCITIQTKPTSVSVLTNANPVLELRIANCSSIQFNSVPVLPAVLAQLFVNRLYGCDDVCSIISNAHLQLNGRISSRCRSNCMLSYLSSPKASRQLLPRGPIAFQAVCWRLASYLSDRARRIFASRRTRPLSRCG